MAIKLASWNVEGRLSGYDKEGRGSAEHIMDGIERLDADIAILPEAYLEQTADGVDERLRAMGYDWYDVAYGHDDRDWSKEFLGKMAYLRVLSRVALEDVRRARWGDLRNALLFTATDPMTQAKARFFPIHLDDRDEASRLDQVDDIISAVNESELPVVLAGDFNAMWHEGRARIIGSGAVRVMAQHFPHAGLRHTLTRLNEMADGRTLARLRAEAGLRDADPHHQATTTPKMRDIPYMPSVRIAQIDHMMLSPGVRANQFTVSPDLGSDHRAISARISVSALAKR